MKKQQSFEALRRIEPNQSKLQNITIDRDLEKKSLWQLQSMSLIQAFPALKLVAELSKVSQKNLEFKQNFTKQAETQINSIKEMTAQIFDHFNDYFDDRLTYLDQLIQKIQRQRHKPKEEDQKKQKSQKQKTNQENMTNNKESDPSENVKVAKKKAQKKRVNKVSNNYQLMDQNKQQNEIKLIANNNKNVNLFIADSGQQQTLAPQIFMCNCPYGSNIFTNKDYFLDHLFKCHPPSKKFSIFRQAELKMSHFLLFNKLVENPFLVKQVFQQLFKWQMKNYDELFICECVISGKFIQKGLTFSQNQFIQHLFTDHKDQNLPLSSHYVDFSQKTVVKNNNFNNQREKFQKSHKFSLLKWQKHQKLRQNLFSLNQIMNANILIANLKYSRSQIFGPMMSCKQITKIYNCKDCKVFFKCEQQWKNHMVTNHNGVHLAFAQKQMIFQNQDKQAHQAWLNSIKVCIGKKDTVIKCGCSLHTFSNFPNYNKHIKIIHNGVVQNFSSHIRSENSSKWIENPNFSQAQIIKEMQINNLYYCGHCPKSLFQIKNQYIMHILTDHDCFHPKNSHFIVHFNDPEFMMKNQKIVQKDKQKLDQQRRHLQKQGVGYDGEELKDNCKGKETLIKIPRKPRQYKNSQKQSQQQDKFSGLKQPYYWKQTQRRPILVQNLKKISLIDTQSSKFDYLKTERKKPSKMQMMRVTRYNSTQLSI